MTLHSQFEGANFGIELLVPQSNFAPMQYKENVGRRIWPLECVYTSKRQISLKEEKVYAVVEATSL